jgi:hypothetical protein
VSARKTLETPALSLTTPDTAHQMLDSTGRKLCGHSADTEKGAKMTNKTAWRAIRWEHITTAAQLFGLMADESVRENFRIKKMVDKQIKAGNVKQSSRRGPYKVKVLLPEDRNVRGGNQ